MVSRTGHVICLDSGRSASRVGGLVACSRQSASGLVPPSAGLRRGTFAANWSIPGIDGFKETAVAMYGDRWLQCGIAVLTLEGLGHCETAVNGIHVIVPNWIEAGHAVME